MGERWVYFVQVETDGPIKIGWAVNPLKRLAELQIGNHHELRLLGACAGGWEREMALHQELAEHRVRGEWFAPTEPVLATVARCTSGVDAWDETVYWARRAGVLGPDEWRRC